MQKLLSVGGRGWGRGLEDGEVIAEGATRCRSGVSFGGWSRTSGAGLAGCWQTGAEPTLIRTSLHMDVQLVPTEQVHRRRCPAGRQTRRDEVGPC